ncbi:MAG: glycosyltransferase family 2 protein [Candidatus Tectomicrobia bacterium]|nr:glycosyltransferase family 2 protein [Candidatus Tectomicrobia bacterium]
MDKISATIITYNEELNIRDALESVAWADEIVVVDSHSQDITLEICKEYTDRIIQHDWSGHIRQKNFAIDQASFPWILSIDADERISPELKEEIEQLRKIGMSMDGYFIPRKAFYLGRWIRHSGWYPDYKVRLFRKEKGRWSGTNPHDSVKLEGEAGYLKGVIEHYSYRDLAHNLDVINRYSTIGAEELHKLGKRTRWHHLVLNPPLTFLKKYLLKQGYRDGIPGFFIAALTAYSAFCKYAKLWEMRDER